MLAESLVIKNPKVNSYPLTCITVYKAVMQANKSFYTNDFRDLDLKWTIIGLLTEYLLPR